jgi:hypothetical protein
MRGDEGLRCRIAMRNDYESISRYKTEQVAGPVPLIAKKNV